MHTTQRSLPRLHLAAVGAFVEDLAITNAVSCSVDSAMQIKAREAVIAPYEVIGARSVLDTLTGPPRRYREAVRPRMT